MTMTDTTADAEPDAAPPALYRLTGVTRTYRQKDRIVTALAGVDLEIAAGDFVTIQGPTGGGKSTLLQLLGALDRPSAGTVRLGDIDLARRHRRASSARMRATEIGFVFQGFNLIPTLTAHENVDMALEPLGLSKPERAGAGRRGARRTSGLADRADHRPGELSGGQQQRVAIARAHRQAPAGAAGRRADRQPRREHAGRDPGRARVAVRRGADAHRRHARLGGRASGSPTAAARARDRARHHPLSELVSRRSAA